MKRIGILFILIVCFSIPKTFAQVFSDYIYFKASEARLPIGKDTTLKGPFACDDIVFINFKYNQIVIMSSTARVYTIEKMENKSHGIDARLDCQTRDASGKKVNFYLISHRSSKTDSRIIYQGADGTGLMVLDGKSYNVF